ncbi:MAG: cytochrome C, partial [Dehalococcoidia bacterium]|nr:cytochrome C [Dehalococcoidia bacterium]
GDGPGSVGLEPPPADLLVHVPLHPDPDLFGIISDGVAGSAMVPFGDVLTEDEIWHLINYLQTLE